MMRNDDGKEFGHSSKSVRAVIFDMDGTLINSTKADFLAWKKIFNEFGETLNYEQYLDRYLGIKSAELMRSKFRLEGEELKETLLRKLEYFKTIVEDNGIETIPYAIELVDNLKAEGYKLAVATSARRSKMEWVLKQLNLFDKFDVIVSGDDVKTGKPDPAVFLQTARLLGVKPEECLVFEDAVSGIRAAKSAGMKTIGITTTQDAERLDEADLIIRGFENIENRIFYR